MTSEKPLSSKVEILINVFMSTPMPTKDFLKELRKLHESAVEGFIADLRLNVSTSPIIETLRKKHFGSFE